LSEVRADRSEMRDYCCWLSMDGLISDIVLHSPSIDPKFLDENLNDHSLQDFFASGERHVEHVYTAIRSGMRPDFQPVRVLDYGCGVGRLVVPFASRSQEVVGVDVSPSMLEAARENCKRLGANSVSLLHAKDLDSLAPASFDLVHSYIVFQHIPVARGELILRKLTSLISEGGVGAIHLTYADSRSLTLIRGRLTSNGIRS
jgi:2-polyprenyl-3-methyl-5-hydroxy-6-metoxy-1,4-benzoquinol methylase